MNGVAILPESASIDKNGWDLKIKNHKVETTNGLFDWMMFAVWYDDLNDLVPEMEQQGIDWYGAAEYMATEIECNKSTFVWGLYWMSPTNMSIEVCKKIAKTGTGQKIIKDVIYAIRHCDSYAEFGVKFKREDEFVQGIKNTIDMEMKSWYKE